MVFKQKFKTHTYSYDWKQVDCKHCLFGVCLGKPLITTLYSTIADRGEDITYILSCSDWKTIVEETWMNRHRSTFTHAVKQPGESYWADQVLSLANRAYSGLRCC